MSRRKIGKELLQRLDHHVKRHDIYGMRKPGTDIYLNRSEAEVLLGYVRALEMAVLAFDRLGPGSFLDRVEEYRERHGIERLLTEEEYNRD